jgi:hypothetical protein
MREAASETDNTRAVTDTARGSKKEPIGIRLRTAWHVAARALLRRDPQPQPERRRRREDTGRAFRTAARMLTPRPCFIGRLASSAFGAAARRIAGRVIPRFREGRRSNTAVLPLTLDPMNPYWEFDIDGDNELAEDCDYASSGPSIAPNP